MMAFPSVIPKSLIGNPKAFNYCGTLTVTLRGDTSFVMPEIFYQASMLLLFLWLFDTSGPLIEPFRGDDTEAFSSGLFYVFFLCLFVFSSFPGAMRGLAPSLSVLSFPKSLIGNPSFCLFFCFNTVDPS